MKLNSIISLSSRNLLDGKMRSILTISGVSIGFSTIVFLLAFGFGIEKLTTSQISSGNTLRTFKVTSQDTDSGYIETQAITNIAKLNSVTEVESSSILPGKISNGSLEVDTSLEATTTSYMALDDMKIVSGEMFEDSDVKALILTTGLLDELNIDRSSYSTSNIQIAALPNTTYSENKTIEIKNMYISGIVDDTSPIAYFPMKGTKDIFKSFSLSTALVKSQDSKNIPGLRKKVEEMGYTTYYKEDTIKQINSIFSIFRFIIGIFGFIAVVVSILGMFNTLTISLLERTQEIALLKSFGAKKQDIFKLFLTEAMLISIVGGIIGILTGLLLGELFNLVFNIYAKMNQGYPVDLFYLPLVNYLYIMLGILGVGLLTGFYPALRASRVKVLEAIKNE
jgi:putative ABC transport system permease protein